MKIIPRLNQIRRTISANLFNKYGKDSLGYNIVDHTKPLSILVVRPNGRLGNLLLATPLLQEMQNTFPNAKIHFFAKGGLGPILYKNYAQIESYINLPGRPFDNLRDYLKNWTRVRRDSYDIVVNIASGSASGKLAVKMAKSKYKYYGLIDENLEKQIPDYRHFGKLPVYNFRKYMNTPSAEIPKKPIPKLSLQLTDREIADGKMILNSLVDTNRQTIGVYTFATGDKCLNEDWWLPFYQQLKQQFPNCNIVEVLPKENVSQINFEAVSYYSTNIRELTAVLSLLDVFVTADCGIMHLASATNTPVISLFSISSISLYAPYNNDKSKAIYVQDYTQKEIIEFVKEGLDFIVPSTLSQI